MQLTQWTDYSLRILMYCAKNHNRKVPITIAEIVKQHQLSKSHVTKIVSFLSAKELLHTARGRNGGVSLARPATDIKVGDVVRLTENNLNIVECFDRQTNTCKIASTCTLKHLLFKATSSFFKELDNVSLADISF